MQIPQPSKESVIRSGERENRSDPGCLDEEGCATEREDQSGRCALGDLELRLAQIYLKRVEKVAFVRGDADVDFLYVADVIDLAHHAGVQRVGLMTQNGE